jgi:hypothetical protein
MNDLVTQRAANVPTNPADLQAYYNQMATAYAASEQRESSGISIKNGIMSVGDQPIPGNQFAAVILDAVRLNTFYRTTYNPHDSSPPHCYAIGRDDAEMRPHPDMAKDMNHFQPQAEHCSGCPHNEFGSGQNGKGKACSNRRRLIMLLAGTYQNVNGMMQLQPMTDPEHYRTTGFLHMTLPPTTLKAWGEYVRASAAQYQRPFFGLVTRIYLYAHPVHGKEAVGFEPLAMVPDEWAMNVIPRQQKAMQEIMEGYEPPQNSHPQGGFHGQQQQAVR